MDDILDGFCDETKPILADMAEILRQIEEDPSRSARLGEYALKVDGIMGNAKVIAVDYPTDHVIQKIAVLSELCRFLARLGPELSNSVEITKISVSFMLDATDLLCEMNAALKGGGKAPSELLNQALVGRLRILSQKFDGNRKATVITKETTQSTQDDIDAILRQLSK